MSACPVAIRRDPNSQLHYLACHPPCGGARCDQMTDAAGHPPGHPAYAGGVCWLGSGLTEEGARQLAARHGHPVVAGRPA